MVGNIAQLFLLLPRLSGERAGVRGSHAHFHVGMVGTPGGRGYPFSGARSRTAVLGDRLLLRQHCLGVTGGCAGALEPIRGCPPAGELHKVLTLSRQRTRAVIRERASDPARTPGTLAKPFEWRQHKYLRQKRIRPYRPPSTHRYAKSAAPRPPARSGLPCRRCPRRCPAACRCRSW